MEQSTGLGMRVRAERWLAPKLVATGIAARELGIHRYTLLRWWESGLVEPAFVTAGGHARWDMDELRRQLQDQRQRDE